MVSIPRYAQRITAGTINPRPVIRVEHETGISAQVDGDNGPGQWVAVVAMETAIRIAREKGVGIVAVRRSNHLGAAGHYPWLAAREGLIGLCTTTGPVILAPTGGITPTFGNNPLGVGIPAKCHHPILLDIAMSVAPRGRIGLRLPRGSRCLPAGFSTAMVIPRPIRQISSRGWACRSEATRGMASPSSWRFWRVC